MVSVINKRTFVKKCALENGLTQTQVYSILTYLIETIKENLRNDEQVSLPGIGKIYPVNKKTKNHYHPVSKELYKSKEYKTLKIDVYPSFREELNT